MNKFEEAFGKLVDEHLEKGTALDDIVSAVELWLMAMKEEQDN